MTKDEAIDVGVVVRTLTVNGEGVMGCEDPRAEVIRTLESRDSLKHIDWDWVLPRDGWQ